MSEPSGIQPKNISGVEGPLQQKPTLQESPIAIQMTSKGALLKLVSESVKGKESDFWQSYPITRGIDTYFARRSAREEYVSALRTQFVGEGSTTSSTNAAVFDTVIKPTLLSTKLETITGFESFTSASPGKTYFTSAYESLDARSRTKTIKQNLERVMTLVDTKEKEVNRLFSAYTGAQEVFEELPAEAEYHVLDTFITDFEETKPPEGETRLDRFETFVDAAKPLKGPLKEKSVENRGAFLKFVITKAGHQHVMKALSVHGNNPTMLSTFIDSAVEAQKMGNLTNLELTLAYMPIVAKIIDRMKPEHELEYYNAWLLAAGELEPTEFEAFLEQYAKHLEQIEKLQAERPVVYDHGSLEQNILRGSFMELAFHDYAIQMQRLALFDLAMRDATVIDNRQILQYSLAAFYLGATNKLEGARSVPNLSSRCTTASGGNVPYGLSNQINIPFTLEGEDTDIIENFSATTDIYVTDPNSMETRSVRIPLPISGRITVGEAKKQLKLLKTIAGNHDRFDSEFDEQEFPEEKRAELREAFILFDTKLGVAFGRALGDFNSTETRPRESSVRESPTIKAFIEAPSSKVKAIEAAKTKNLFLLEGKTLSLLPSGPGEGMRGIGTLASPELSSAANQLLGKTEESTEITVPTTLSEETELKTATLKLEMGEELVDGTTPYFVIETTIKLEDKTHTRKSYYDIEGKSIDEVKTEILESKLFERDLLLAKAEFMEKHIK